MRDSLQCPKCSHREILRAPLRDGSGHPMSIASVVTGALLLGSQPVGMLVAYACRRCGYCELFVDTPSAVGDDAMGCEVLAPDEDGDPFRR